jgi:hypothetical protein
MAVNQMVNMAPVVALLWIAAAAVLAAAVILIICALLLRRWRPGRGPDDDDAPGPWEPDPGGAALAPGTTRRALCLAA